MSYVITSKIKEFRKIRGFNQEQMANKLNMSIQEYSRLENNQINISFIKIKQIAEILGVSTQSITNLEKEKRLVDLFKENNGSTEIIQSISRIKEILKCFNAHEKLYYQMKV